MRDEPGVGDRFGAVDSLTDPTGLVAGVELGQLESADGHVVPQVGLTVGQPTPGLRTYSWASPHAKTTVEVKRSGDETQGYSSKAA